MPIAKERLHELTQCARTLFDAIEHIDYEATRLANKEPNENPTLNSLQDFISNKRRSLSSSIHAAIVREETHWKLTRGENERKKLRAAEARQSIPKAYREATSQALAMEEIEKPLSTLTNEQRMKEASRIAFESIGEEIIQEGKIVRQSKIGDETIEHIKTPDESALTESDLQTEDLFLQDK